MRKRITKQVIDALTPKRKLDGKLGPDFLWDTNLTGFGCKVTAAGNKVYILQYRTRGQNRSTAPKRVTLGKHGAVTPDQARKLAAKLLLEVKAGNDPAKSWRERQDQPTVATLARRFLEDHLPRKKRPPRQTTIETYERLFRLHILPGLGRVRVKEVTTDDVERLHARLRDMPYQANRALSVLHQAFDQAERWGWRPQGTNPALHVDRYPEERRGARKEVMLTAEQMAEFLDAITAEEEAGADPIACAAIQFVFWTGWRVNEVLRLEWTNIDLEAGRAKLLRTKTAEEEYRSLPAEAFKILHGIPRLVGCPYVFPGRDTRSYLTTVRKPWVRIRKRAGLDSLDVLGPLRLHDLRHNVVSWDVSRGVPLKIAGKNVGHRSQQATEVYAHFSPDALRQAADDRARAMREALEAAT